MPRIDLIQPRGGTAAEWTSANPILEVREMGEETDTGKSKRGDGVTAWNDLPYFSSGGTQNLQQVTEEGATTDVLTTFSGGLRVGNETLGVIDFKPSAPFTEAIFYDGSSGSIGFIGSTLNILNGATSKGIVIDSDGLNFITGTNPTVGQVLAATDTNGQVEWTTVSGGSSPLTTKGDLYTYSTEDARLPVGTNGQVLSADSTEATGLKWVNASGSASLPWIDITQSPYNAVADALGDAGVDSTTAWNSALDDLETAGGGVLYIPYTNGTRFNITPENATTRDYSNITIMSFVSGNIFVKDTTATASQGRGVLLNLGANTTNFEVRNLDILVSDGAFRNNFQTGVICSQAGNISNITIDNCVIKNQTKLDTAIGVDGITFFRNTADPIDNDEITNLTIKNCEIDLYGNSIYGIQLLRKVNNPRILNNNLTLHANSSESASAFNAIAVYGDSIDFLVQGNTVYGSGHSAIAISTARNGQVVNNKVYNVMFNQSNLDEAGIEVEYKAGHGDATLTTYRVIVSNNYVEHCKYGIAVFERSDSATTLAPYEVLISDNIVHDSSDIDIVVYSQRAGVPDYTSRIKNVTIDNNICTSTAGAGIRIYDAEDCSITNNELKGQTNGIVLGRSGTIYITGDFIVANNRVKNVTTNGFWVESGVDVNLTVSGNKVYGGNYGFFMNINIDLNNISTLQMIGNFAKGQSIDGFFIKPNTDGGQLIGNTALSCGAQGFDVALSDGLYTNNTARNCTTASAFTGPGSVATNNKEI